MALTWKKRRAFPSTADQEPRSGRTPWFSAAAEGERDLQTRLRGRGGREREEGPEEWCLACVDPVSSSSPLPLFLESVELPLVK
jgi:hypothetical protein